MFRTARANMCRIFLKTRTTPPSRGISCSDKPVDGRARFSANLIGPTGRVREPWSDLAAGPPVPGEHWEYNDTRVNLLALAALEVARRPLPDILRERIMEPIGASDAWHWEGYENSYVDIDGEMIQSVAGGGHWGGGMFISARDQARFGLLGLHRGNWGRSATSC